MGWLSWDITGFLQRWVNGDSLNYGICLRVVDEVTSLHGTVCYSSDEASNITSCPKLEVTYKVPVSVFYF